MNSSVIWLVGLNCRVLYSTEDLDKLQDSTKQSFPHQERFEKQPLLRSELNQCFLFLHSDCPSALWPSPLPDPAATYEVAILWRITNHYL